ncbi:hypothetical protein [Chloroflexus sp.]|uniref:hypothetical protein n=1 Tax=Chloroflexus sp. TaxID=1904827 RepID=UPI002ACE0717|nr:hypothetical protein [Chloroflexus sp.]
MTVIDQIIERVHVRQSRYQHIETDLNRAPLDAFARISPVILGACSAVVVFQNIRLVDRPALIHVNGVSETATSLARDYLRVKFGSGRSDGHHVPLEIRRSPEPFAPFFCPRAVASDQMVYIDLKSAYWTIVRRVGWLCVYRPGRYLGKDGSVADFPWPNHRLARNTLVTASAPGVRRILEGKKVKEEKFHNPLLNFPLLHVVSDVLHAVAADMIRLGAVHVHTDGYIFTSVEQAREAMRFLEAEWALRASVRLAGPGIVKAPGAWKIGVETTDTFHVVSVYSEGVSNVREVRDIPWLRRTFRDLAKYDSET